MKSEQLLICVLLLIKLQIAKQLPHPVCEVSRLLDVSTIDVGGEMIWYGLTKLRGMGNDIRATQVPQWRCKTGN